MKIIVKRIYCSKCQRLVRGREDKTGNASCIVCVRCGKVLRVADGVAWRSVREAD